MEDIFEVEVDENSYEIKIHKETSDEGLIRTFSTTLDYKEYDLSCKVTSELVNDLKGIRVNVEEELKNILFEEIKLEISRHYDGAYWKQHILTK